MTLDELDPQNNQQVFDYIVSHLRTQGAKSLEGRSCRYRNAVGLKCAVGCLIPDADYTEAFEGGGVYSTLINDISKYLTARGFELLLLDAMQMVHDVYQVHQWEYQFREVAKRFNLQYSEPST